jgi:hypothetical protein
MDDPVIIIEAQKLNKEAAVGVLNFLHDLIIAFESHYYYQLTNTSDLLRRTDLK